MAAVLEDRWAPRTVSRFGSIDRTICSISSKLRPQRDVTCRFPLIWLRRLVHPGRDDMGRIVVLAADHQLPGDAGHLVGQRHGGELGRFALQQLDQPRRGLAPVPCQGQALPRRTCWITAVAPTTSTLRKASSPARVMPPSRVLPAVE